MDFEGRLKKAAGRRIPAKDPAVPAYACPSPAEYESQLQRSTAAAAALLEQDEAEKAAEQLKQAKAGKKAKANIKQHQARSKAAKNSASGNAAQAGKHGPWIFTHRCLFAPFICIQSALSAARFW